MQRDGPYGFSGTARGIVINTMTNSKLSVEAVVNAPEYSPWNSKSEVCHVTVDNLPFFLEYIYRVQK